MGRFLRQGFSLVEIVLAIGIVSVVLVTSVGLLSVSLNTDRASSAATTVASMSEFVLTGLRSQALTNFSLATAQPRTDYFDREGNWLGTNAAPGAVYACASTFSASNAPAAGTFYEVAMRFTWPYPNTNHHHTQRASLVNF